MSPLAAKARPVVLAAAAAVLAAAMRRRHAAADADTRWREATSDASR